MYILVVDNSGAVRYAADTSMLWIGQWFVHDTAMSIRRDIALHTAAYVDW